MMIMMMQMSDEGCTASDLQATAMQGHWLGSNST
jgi:hypothetical protein